MKMIFRFDDITPTMDWNRFEQMKRLLQKYGITGLLGVIPDCQDESLRKEEERATFWEEMRKLQDEGWVIAQHGWQHRYVNRERGIFPVNRHSEFAGLPYSLQLQKIASGKRRLEVEGISPKVFMAPAHSYDENTRKALVKCGFRFVTDGCQWC